MGSQRVRHDLATKPPLPGLLYFFLSLEKLSAAHHHLLLSLHHIPGYTPTDLSLRRRSWMTHMYEMGALVMLVAQPCPNSCDLMDCRPPGSSVHGVLQAGILECAANPFSRGYFPDPGIKPRSPTLQAVSLPSEPPGKPKWAPSFFSTSFFLNCAKTINSEQIQ